MNNQPFNESYELARAVPADIPGILAVLEKNLLVNQDQSAVSALEQGGFLIMRHSTADLRSWIEDKKNHIVLVCKQGQEILGYVMACDWQALSAELRNKLEKLDSVKNILEAGPLLYHKQIAIHPGRKGLGGQLLRRLFESASEKGYHQLVCIIVQEPVFNQVSHAFHQKHGFKCIGHIQVDEMKDGVYIKLA